MGSLVGRPSRSSAEESQAVDHSTLYTLYGVRSNQDREYFKEREKKIKKVKKVKKVKKAKKKFKAEKSQEFQLVVPPTPLSKLVTLKSQTPPFPSPTWHLTFSSISLIYNQPILPRSLLNISETLLYICFPFLAPSSPGSETDWSNNKVARQGCQTDRKCLVIFHRSILARIHDPLTLHDPPGNRHLATPSVAPPPPIQMSSPTNTH